MTEPHSWKEQGTEPRTPAQLRMLNAVCGCLSDQVRWHGYRLSKDDYRHMLSGLILGCRPLPAYDYGDGRHGIIYLGGSSLALSKTQASEAIEMGLHIGDDPSAQGLKCKAVTWSDVIYLANGWNPDDFKSEGGR